MINHTRRNGQIKELPKTVSLYNQNMGGIDPLDQMVDHVAGERPFHKFWKKCLFSIIDRMAFCSYILYEQNTSARRKFTRFRFMCTLVEELCATPEDQPVAIPIPVRQANLVHRAVLLPGKKEKDCVVCSDRSTPAGRKRSRTQCEGCGIGVHLKCLISLTMLQKRENKQTTSFETQFLMGCHDELLFTVICQSYSVVHLTSACHEPLHYLFLSVCIWKKRVSIM